MLFMARGFDYATKECCINNNNNAVGANPGNSRKKGLLKWQDRYLIVDKSRQTVDGSESLTGALSPINIA